MRLALAVLLLASMPANADIIPMPAKVFCGPIDEVKNTLNEHTVVMRGPQGSDSSGIAEVLLNEKTGYWFVIQIIPKLNRACVVLGGSGGLKFVDEKPGQPA